METEDVEFLGTGFPISEEDSGSAFEISDEEHTEHSSSDDKKHQALRLSGASPNKKRYRSWSRGRKDRDSSFDEDGSESESEGEKSRDSSTVSQREERRRQASEWAATFREPQSPSDIRTPDRQAAGTQTKRKALKSPSQVRAKRLKSWYNNEYRELLNVDIHDAMVKAISEDEIALEGSQIGSSIWTSKEKGLFFSTLSRLDRNNVQAIACRIGTKSELEVQEYIQLLHQGVMENSNKLLGSTDLPAAIEISDECCIVLERAADALGSRQERCEELGEQEKWGELWLLTSDANRRLEKQRKDEAGMSVLQETLPAANLFHLGNWLDLSCRIFMNSNTEEDNWGNLAEQGEKPALRATVFEDFHSLAINITKRIISAALFCTMSRQRATNSRIVKHADVNKDDVEAAVKILGLKLNSEDFWQGCASRCNLKVFDEERNSFMSYEEVEQAIKETRRERSRSRPSSHRERSVSPAAQSDVDPEARTESSSYSSDDRSDDDSLHSYGSDLTNSARDSDGDFMCYLTQSEAISFKSRRDYLLQKARARKEAERAQDKYVEGFDQKASNFEEQRLWDLLRQTAPFDIKLEDLQEPPQGTIRDDMIEQLNWRDRLEYRSQWETLDSPVPKEHFEKNRKRISRRARKRAGKARRLNSLEDDGVLSSTDEEDEYSNRAKDESEKQDAQDDDHHDQFKNQEEVPIDLNNEARHKAGEIFEDQDEDDEGSDSSGHHGHHHKFKNEPLDSDNGSQATHHALVSPSPMYTNAGHLLSPSADPQDPENDFRIKDEYDSS